MKMSEFWHEPQKKSHEKYFGTKITDNLNVATLFLVHNKYPKCELSKINDRIVWNYV